MWVESKWNERKWVHFAGKKINNKSIGWNIPEDKDISNESSAFTKSRQYGEIYLVGNLCKLKF